MPTKGKLYQRIGSFLTALVLTISGTSIAWPVFFSENASAANYNADKLFVSDVTKTTVELNDASSVSQITISALNMDDWSLNYNNPILLSNDATISAYVDGGDIQPGCTGAWKSNTTYSDPAIFSFTDEILATVKFCFKGSSKGTSTINFFADFIAPILSAGHKYPDSTSTDIVVSDTIDPVAVADEYTVAEDGELNVSAALGVLANDTDASNSLTAAVVFGYGAEHGTLALAADGSFTYTPNTDFNGVEKIKYSATDSSDHSSEAIMTINVASVNDAPIANSATFNTDEDTAIDTSLSATDVENNSVTFTVIADPTKGTLSGTAPDLKYTPNTDFNGVDTFTFIVNDGIANSSPATVTINVGGFNDAPFAVGDTAVTDNNVPVDIDVIENDSDIDGDTIKPEIVEIPTNGSAEINSDGTIKYTPAPGFAGTDTFTYKISDGVLDSNVATVTVTVADTIAPIISANDLIIEALTPSYIYMDMVTADDGIGSGVEGEIAITANDVDLNKVGTYHITYSVADKAGNVGTKTVTVVVLDTTKPVITLIGDAIVNLVQGSVYTDAGAKAVDNYDGDLTAKIVAVNTVNAAVVGTYKVKYNVTDANGNDAAEVVRTVNVVAPVAPVVVTPVTTVEPESNLTEIAQEVMSATDTTGEIDEDAAATDVKSATTKKDNTWKIIGLAWYWWLLILTIAAYAWWFIAAKDRKENESKNTKGKK